MLPTDAASDEGIHIKCLDTFLNINEDMSNKSTFENNVKMYAMVLDDNRMLDKISGIDFLAKDPYCRRSYQSQAENITVATSTYWHDSINLHAEVFNEICNIVKLSVLENYDVFFISELTGLYRSILMERGLDEDLLFTSQHLQEKLLKHFDGEISVDSGNKKRGNILYKKGMEIDQVVRAAFDLKRQASVQLRDVAFKLRKCIFDWRRN